MAKYGNNSKAELVTALNGALADTFALYVKTKNFHWHVAGPNFRDLHLMFDDQAGQLIGGSILVETVFAWPGIGRLAFDALLARDYAVLLGVFFCTSVMVVGFNLVTDLLYAIVDPRVEVEG